MLHVTRNFTHPPIMIHPKKTPCWFYYFFLTLSLLLVSAEAQSGFSAGQWGFSRRKASGAGFDFLPLTLPAGRVFSVDGGNNPVALDVVTEAEYTARLPLLGGLVDWSQITTGKPTTLAGYGIVDAALLASPSFTGVPLAPTAAPGTNTTQLATTAFVLANSSSSFVQPFSVKTGTGTLNVVHADSGKHFFIEQFGTAEKVTLNATGITSGDYFYFTYRYTEPSAAAKAIQLPDTSLVTIRRGETMVFTLVGATWKYNTLGTDMYGGLNLSGASYDGTQFLTNTSFDADGKATLGWSSLDVELGLRQVSALTMPTGKLVYRKTAGTGVAEFQTLATLKTDLLLTGTNSGDQTTIVGITGTTAQFNTALTDNDFATLAGTETLSAKTLTAPKFASGGFLADANGNEELIFITTASAVNELTLTNAATGNPPILSVSGIDPNVGLFIKPKGTGAFMVDGSAFVAGNARGANAIDMPTGRSSAAQVASGANSSLVGAQNSTAGGTNAGVFGGVGNSGGGSYSFVAGGYVNTANGNYSFVSGGYQNTASGDQSSVINGYLTQATASESMGTGFESVANRKGMFSRAEGKFTSYGDAQMGICVLRRSLNTATQSDLTLDGATPSAAGTAITTNNRFTLNANSTVMADAYITASSSVAGTNYRGCYHRRCLITRNGASATSLEGAVQTVGTDIETAAIAASWDVTLTADDTSTNDVLCVKVTGTAVPIQWVCRLEFVENIFP